MRFTNNVRLTAGCAKQPKSTVLLATKLANHIESELWKQ